MNIDLSAFHFLRPWWLLVVPFAVLLWWSRHRVLGAPGRDSRIAPDLVPYLIVRASGSRGPRPIDMLALTLVLGAFSAAGPTWQRDEPAYLDNVAPLIVAMDLSASMNGTDIPPSRLGAAKHLLRDLSAHRAGAKTGLIAYAGSAHLVMPPTDDSNLLDLFTQALSSDLTDRTGRNVAAVIALSARVLQAEQAGGTLLLVTDGANADHFDAVREQAQAAADMQVLVMAVGQVGLDVNAIRDLADAAGAPLGSLTGSSDDLDWVTLHAQQHFRAVQDEQTDIVHWNDVGYWLCWPLVLLALFTIRRGWNVSWLGCLLMAVMLGTTPTAHAGALADAFLTADQQGRAAFERGHYEEAAQRFHDTYWKGRAAYQTGKYKIALVAFSSMKTAEGYFYVGNTQVHLRQYDAAIDAYDQALSIRPDWKPAIVNRDIVSRLIDAMSQEQQGEPADSPDQTINDKTAQTGKMEQVPVSRAASEDVWLRNLTISPARFLRGKFAVEDAAAGGQP